MESVQSSANYDLIFKYKHGKSDGYAYSLSDPMSFLMEKLAKQLNDDVCLLNSHLETAGHPHPSFDSRAPRTTLPGGTPEHIQLSRERIMNNALQLFQLAAGPSEFLPNLSTSVGQDRRDVDTAKI